MSNRKICFITGTRTEYGVIIPLTKGEIFTANNIGIKRHGNDFFSMRWYEILGKESLKNYNTDELI